MRKLSSIILLVLLSASLIAQKSPHGDSFKANCDDCHKTDGWKVDLKTVSFDHSKTRFPLVGQHQSANCKQCHTSLEFAVAKTDCNSCHIDFHEQTVGTDCSRCHTPKSWTVTNITQLHQQGRFPLLGAHKTADCRECHKNMMSSATAASPTASFLRFDPLGVQCYDCHKANYESTTSPKHEPINYPPDNCTVCHKQNAFSWKFNHGTITGECKDCHIDNYNTATNPNHISLNLPTSCKDCHTTESWKPAEYRDHDAISFPIYSGNHAGEWNSCSDCHKNPADYGQFTCIDCHEHSSGKTDGNHDGVSGYVYNSAACYACHPTGSEEGSMDHSKTAFPLTGAHTTTSCGDCHKGVYAGTPKTCASCHISNYNATSKPSHKIPNSAFTEDCIVCHTTAPGWKPATYPSHSKLTGAHVPIANNCDDCHKGNYTALPKTCNDCHSSDFTQSINPSHVSAQFPTTCPDCHSQTAWKPANWNHDGEYFPIYSGEHKGEWDNCADCHKNSSNYKSFTCTSTCHLQPKMNSEHQGVSGYQYNDPACLACHPTGKAEGSFNHSSSGFPLTGGHASDNCAGCHTAGYVNTPTVCNGCHTPDYNQSVNPNHITTNISTDCAVCHTTALGWKPAAFATHNNYYAIAGAHIPIANDCASCHNGNYVNSPNTCFGCHDANFNQTTKPNHAAAQFATTCESCHTQTAWKPSTFDHNTVYPLIGAHATVAVNCDQCHAAGYANTPNTCVGCHQPNYNQAVNPNHTAAQFPNTCADCHTPAAWKPSNFNHDGQYFPVYSGKHKSEWDLCSDCHTNASNYQQYTCTSSCHLQPNMNTKHQGVVGYQFNSPACLACHPAGTAEGAFNHSSSPFPLTGGHTNATCASCHTNGYVNTSTVCSSCHTPNYNQAANPNHTSLNISTDCATCHTTNPGWNPATFPTHNNYYVLAGAHIPVANQCAQCHNGNYNNTPNTCVGCHLPAYNQTTNPNHAAGQYPTTCATCHTQSAWVPASFNHNTVYPLTGAHATVTNCNLCHVNGYTNTPNTCVGCHQANYNQSANPSHNALNLSTNCATCHTTNPGWAPATFPVHNNYYVLAGAHVPLTCNVCHNGNYNNTPNTCSGCHMPDYTQATDPNHVTAQFPTTCAECHTQTAWSPSTFNHDGQYFPIYSGKHKNKWNTCSQCHPNAANYAIFTCTSSGCHSQSSTNSEHNGVANYVYNSINCLNCHPNGAGDKSLHENFIRSN
jgi:hypothetical protein